MLDFCKSIFDYGSDLCELTNNQTLTIEIIIAITVSIFAGSLAVMLYLKEKNNQAYESLERTIRDLENKIHIVELEILNFEQRKIVKEQQEIIKEIKPIIEKQNEIISEREDKRMERGTTSTAVALTEYNMMRMNLQVLEEVTNSKKYNTKDKSEMQNMSLYNIAGILPDIDKIINSEPGIFHHLIPFVFQNIMKDFGMLKKFLKNNDTTKC